MCNDRHIKHDFWFRMLSWSVKDPQYYEVKSFYSGNINEDLDMIQYNSIYPNLALGQSLVPVLNVPNMTWIVCRIFTSPCFSDGCVAPSVAKPLAMQQRQKSGLFATSRKRSQCFNVPSPLQWVTAPLSETLWWSTGGISTQLSSSAPFRAEGRIQYQLSDL